VQQGLAMYGGAVTYSQAVRVPAIQRGQRVILRLDRPFATCIRVAVNGKRIATLGWPGFEGWQTDVTRAIEGGRLNRIEIMLVSSRRNLLGPLHHRRTYQKAVGPDEFRTRGDDFVPWYNLVPYGLCGGAELRLFATEAKRH
jgi:hypothetical protein